MEHSKFDDIIENLLEMTSGGVFIQPVDGPVTPPVSGQYGNSVDPTNNDFYAPGDSRIPKGPKKLTKRKKCKCGGRKRGDKCGCKRKNQSN